MASRGRPAATAAAAAAAAAAMARGQEPRRGERKRTGEKRRKKGEGESGTQEAPETGCGQLFTSWRMIHLGVCALTKPVYVDLRGPPPPPPRRRTRKEMFEISILQFSRRASLLFIFPF